MTTDLKFTFPEKKNHIIKVIGVGGGGGNAVNHMYNQGIEGVDFFIANTDKQALEGSEIPNKYQIGENLTEGLGAGADPEKGKKAALENIDELAADLAESTKMIFITAGMGGGTGTGAAPIIAKTAKELGILTVGIVTTPFKFEGKRRRAHAEEGIAKMKESVDSLLVINNDKLREMYGNLSLTNAFEHADNILATAAKSIAEIITFEGYINVDFMDVKSTMENSGVALMGTAIADGDDRALSAAKQALLSPLLADNDIKGAKKILLNIASGKKEITMDETSEITDHIRDEAGDDADLIFGCSRDETLGDAISVTIIATAFETQEEKERKELPFEIEETAHAPVEPKDVSIEIDNDTKIIHTLDDTASLPFEIDSAIEEPTPQVNTRPDEVRVGLGVGRDGSQVQSDRKELNLMELESTPAYIRRARTLESIDHSSTNNISRLTLNTDDEKRPEIRNNNRFLHDNVD
ncbi:MAG: cell division protein FtsZ [Bacteroidia bacterium]